MAKNKNKKQVPPAATVASSSSMATPAAPGKSSLPDNASTSQLPPSPVAGSGGGTLKRAGTSSSSAAGSLKKSTATVFPVTLAPNAAGCRVNTAGRVNSVAGQSGQNLGQSSGKIDKAWTSLFKNNRTATSGAILPQVHEGVSADKILFDINDFMDETQVPSSLVGFFSPKFPGIESVQKVVEAWENKWGIKCTISRHLSSWTVFTLPSLEDALRVLEVGPYLVSGNMLHLKIMPKFFKFGKEDQRTVPVWVQFHNLPLEFWKSRHLGKLCSFIGRPIHTDRLTESRERISFARCLIDVTVGLDLPTHLPVELTDGTSWLQPVLYENVPMFCTLCKGLGHAAAICRSSAEPSLYVMKKSVNRAEKPKVVKKKAMNPASAPKDVWVETGKKTTDTASVEAQVVSTTADVPLVSTEARAPPGILTLDMIEEAVDASSEDEGSGDDSVDDSGSGDDDIVDPGDGVVKGGDELVMALQALPEAFSTYPPPSTTPILNKGV